MRRTLIAAVLFGFAASALAQDKVTFGRKYEPGTYVTTIKTKSDQQLPGPKEAKVATDMTMTMEMTVDKPADKGQKLHMTFRRIQMKMSAPQEMSYDSANADENDNNPMGAQFKEFLDKTIDVTKDEKGATTKIESAGGKGLEGMFKGAMGNDTQLPDKAVAVGDHWDTTVKQDIPMVGAADMKMTSTLRKIEKAGERQVAVVDIEGAMETAKGDKTGEDAPKMKIDMKLKGTMKVDVASGRPLESKMDMDMDLTMPMPGGDKTATMSVKNKTNVEMTCKEGKYEAPKTTAKE